MPRKKQKIDNWPSEGEQGLDIPVINGLDVLALRDALLASNEGEKLLQYLIKSCGIPLSKLAPESLPSFSTATWEACRPPLQASVDSVLTWYIKIAD